MSFCPTKIPCGIFIFPKRILPCGVVVKTSQLVFLMADFKKLKGRPKLKEGKRIKKIDVRFTEDEYLIITALEKEFGISKTELLRLRVLNHADKVIVNSKELILLIDRIGAEMGRSGNNINQLARHANTLNLKGDLSPAVASHFNQLLEDYIQMQRSLETALRKVIRLMGK
jgi:hypothetical protein